MDKKYIGGIVQLPKEIFERLKVYQQELSEELGFKVSMAEAISNAIKKASGK